MDIGLKTIIWQQFGASIDMLENAIKACPDEVWGNRIGFYEFWYLAYHTIFWLDLYMTDKAEGDFHPPKPYTLSELDPAGALPDRVYTKAELLEYLESGRQKVRARISGLTDQDVARKCVSRPSLTAVELLLYVMRHMQHHSAQLNLILRQKIDSAPRWVSITKIKLSDA